MSRLGPLTFGKKEEQIFLGREIAQHRDFSEETARQIDLEVRRLIDEAYQSAHTIVEANQPTPCTASRRRCLERETIDAEEVRLLHRRQGTASDAFGAGYAQRHGGTPQQVLKPESRGRSGGLPEGSPSPAYKDREQATGNRKHKGCSSEQPFLCVRVNLLTGR